MSQRRKHVKDIEKVNVRDYYRNEQLKKQLLSDEDLAALAEKVHLGQVGKKSAKFNEFNKVELRRTEKYERE